MTAVNQCAQCGQTDDHPKIHVGDAFGTSGEVISLHLDCAPHSLVESLRANDPKQGEAIDAARAGTHGDDLRALITSNSEGA